MTEEWPEDGKGNGITDDELERLLDVPFVLWFCPKGCRGYVEWNEGSTQATCQTCGEKSEVSPRGDTSEDEQDADGPPPYFRHSDVMGPE